MLQTSSSSRKTSPYAPGSCRGRYHTDRQPGAALQNTGMVTVKIAESWPGCGSGLTV